MKLTKPWLDFQQLSEVMIALDIDKLLDKVSHMIHLLEEVFDGIEHGSSQGTIQNLLGLLIQFWEVSEGGIVL